ncbi:S-layer homology domain-containing protein [Paenibacillus silvisoli]|uniref:S-layer homology domain-containing protein n=1 Tax=Paenibacillus silvisoli TaxID=3110539 RepID=UPI002804246B|nr:S-layer homology domain-containing protein [Paenibacillus silvisoli]
MKRTRKWIVNTQLAALLLGALSPAAWGSRAYAADAVVTAAAAGGYYVATNGNDAWSGKLSEPNAEGTDGPFRTVEHARDVVRAAIAGGMTEDVTVWIHGGRYDFDTALSFNESDSGRDGHEVIYRNVTGEEPIFSGGHAITGWTVYQGSIYQANVGTDADFNTLYEGGMRSVKARYPNAGYSRVEGKFEGADTYFKQFKFAAGDIPAVDDTSGMQVYVWPGGPLGEWNWHANIIDVDSIDYASRTAVLKEGTSYELGVGSRYFVQNRLEFLDQPGEFYLDRAAGKVYYWPRSADIATAEITAPGDARIVEFKGSSGDAPVTHITFDGITVRGSDSLPTTEGYHTDGMVHMENAESITVANSDIYNSGVYGISMEGHNENNKIIGNRIHDTGISAIRIQGAWESTAYVSKKNIVRNNDIFRTGREVGHGAGIDLNETGENVISHNRIHDSTRYGINFLSPRPGSIVGKTIDGIVVTRENARDFTHTENNIVEYNELFNVNTDSQDTGVISSWGADTGNVIRNNRIHDSGVQFSFGFAIYLDDASDGFQVYDNIVDHMQSTKTDGILSSVFMTKGVGNQVYNNIAADNNVSKAAIETFQLGDEPNNSLVYGRNVIYNSGDTMYAFSNWEEDRFASTDHNVFFADGASAYKVAGVPNVSDLDGWRSALGNKYDQHSLVVDPGFMHPEAGDYRPGYASPAYSVGYRDVNIEAIGLEPGYRFATANDPLDRVFVRRAADTVNRSWMNLAAGETAQLAVSGRTANGYAVSDLSAATVTYSSSAAGVATVNASGVVTAVGSGVARITVEVELNGSVQVTDIDVLVGDVFASASLGAWKNTLLPKETMPLQAALHSQLGAALDPAGFTLSYASASPEVATVDAATGVATAVAPGTAVITVTANNGTVTHTGEFELYVASALLSKVDVASTKQILRVGGTGQLSYTAMLSNDTAADLSKAQVHFESSNPAVATVNESGAFQAVGVGDALLNVSVTLNGVTKIGKLSVAVHPADAALPSGWNVVNYGEAQGLATYTGDGAFTVDGNGFDVWGPKDRFSYLYKNVPASGGYERQTLTATIQSMENTNTDAASGIMFRSSDADNANNANLRILPNGGLRFTYRNAEHPDTWYMLGTTLSYPAALRLDREGDVFTAYYKNGENWSEVGQVTVEMGASVLGGIALFSHDNPSTPAQSRVSGISIVSEPVELSGLNVTAAKTSLISGDTLQLSTKGTGGNHGQYDISGASVTYTSSDTAIARVNGAGLVTAVGQGTATVTASAVVGGHALEGHIELAVTGREKINIALQKPVTVSSEGWLVKGAITDGKLTTANDNDMWSYWAADSKEPGEWLTIDLGEKKDIGTVKVQYPWMRGDWSGAPEYFSFVNVAASVTFQVSDNGTDWKTVIGKSTDVPVTRTVFSPDLYSYPINAQGRYVKLLFEDGAQMSQYDSVGIAEVEVYQTAEPINPGGDSGSTGGGGISVIDTSRPIVTTDGELTLPIGRAGEVQLGDAITVSIPAGASDKELKVTIGKVSDVTSLITDKDVLASPVYEILKNVSENFNKPVTLTFAFDPAKLGAGQRAAVFYYDEAKKTWLEIGGTVNGSSITADVNHFTKFAVMGVGQSPAPSVTDIAGHWSEASIKQAISDGIVKGYADGTFKPEKTVTRAEFAVMLMNALKPEGDGAALTFKDAAQIGAWAQKAVAQAVQAGLLKGYEDGSFRPNAEITRAEMAVILAKALGKSIEANAVTGFADDKEIPAWAKDSAAAMNQAGIMQGKGGNLFVPQAHATRAEAVTVLLKLLAQNGK